MESTQPTDVASLLKEIEDADRAASFFGLSDRFLQILNDIIAKSTSAQLDGARDYLLAENERVLRFLRKFPQQLGVVLNTPEAVRKFWYETLPVDGGSLPVWGSLIRSGLVPDDQLNDLATRVANKWGTTGAVPDAEADAFTDAGIIRVLRDRVLSANRTSFRVANELCHLTLWFLERPGGIDHKLATSIAKALDGEYYSWHLERLLKSKLSDKPEVRAELLAKLDTTPEEIPPRLLEILDPKDSPKPPSA